MTVLTLAMIYDVDCEGAFEPIAVIYFFYGIMWMLGIYLLYFEYKRGLPHAWYTH